MIVQHSIKLLRGMLPQLTVPFLYVKIFCTGLHPPSDFACMPEEVSHVHERLATKNTDFVALYICVIIRLVDRLSQAQA
jgi:hypothetical protein